MTIAPLYSYKERLRRSTLSFEERWAKLEERMDALEKERGGLEEERGALRRAHLYKTLSTGMFLTSHVPVTVELKSLNSPP